MANGRNRYQVPLDPRDQIVTFIATLNPPDLEHFSTFYEQEAAAAIAADAERDEWRPLWPLACQSGNRTISCASVLGARCAAWSRRQPHSCCAARRFVRVPVRRR